MNNCSYIKMNKCSCQQKKRGCPKSNECSAHGARRNDCYTKCGGFDKLNHRNANLLDSPVLYFSIVLLLCLKFSTILCEFFSQIFSKVKLVRSKVTSTNVLCVITSRLFINIYYNSSSRFNLHLE